MNGSDEEKMTKYYAVLFVLGYPGLLLKIVNDYWIRDLKPAIDVWMSGESVVFHPRLVFGLVFLVHWGWTFGYSYTKLERDKYGLPTFLLHVVALICMGGAFYSLNGYNTYPETHSYIRHYLSVTGIALVFVFGHILRQVLCPSREWPNPAPTSKCHIASNSLLLVWGAIFLFSSLFIEEFHLDSSNVWGFILGTIVASVIAFFCWIGTDRAN